MREEYYDQQNINKILKLNARQLKDLIRWNESRKDNKKFKTDKDKIEECKKILKFCREVKRAGYKLGVNYKPAGTNRDGRQYATRKALQNVGGSVRDFIIHQDTTDYDMKNAHPTLLLHIIKNKYPDAICSSLADYVTNRDTILKNFKITKLDVLKTINSDRNTSKNNFLTNLHRELKVIKDRLWNEPDLQHLQDQSKKNKKSSLINKLMCIEERKALETAVGDDVNIMVNMFDGFQLKGEHEDLIKTLNKRTEYCGIEWDMKPKNPLVYVEPETEEESNNPKPYDLVKDEFEKTNFLLEDPTCFVEETIRNGEKHIVMRKMADFRVVHNRKWFYDEVLDKEGNVQLKKTKFINVWLEDEDIRTYHHIDFLPPPLEVEDGVYNTFTGFNYEKENWAETCEEVDYEPLINHLRILVGDDKQEECLNYVLDWMAQSIQYPGIMPKVALVFVSRQGVGKNMFFDNFYKLVFGDNYYMCSENPDDFIGKWIRINNKMCCVWNETEANDSFPGMKKLKALITDPKLRVEQKGIQPFDVKNFNRFLFFSQKAPPVQVEPGDRRFQVMRCGKPQTSDYYKQLIKLMEDRDVLWSFTKMLLNRRVANMDFKNARVKTEYYNALQSGNVSTIDRFLTWCYTEDIIRANPESIRKLQYEWNEEANIIGTSNFMKLYEDYCEKRKFKSLGKQKFYYELNFGYGKAIERLKRNGYWKLRFEPIKLLDILIENGAIDEFDYEELIKKEPDDVEFS